MNWVLRLDVLGRELSFARIWVWQGVEFNRELSLLTSLFMSWVCSLDEFVCELNLPASWVGWQVKYAGGLSSPASWVCSYQSVRSGRSHSGPWSLVCSTSSLQACHLPPQDCASSILAPQTSSLKWPVNYCLAGSQNLKNLSISNVWLSEWTLSGYKNSFGL